MKFFSVWSGFSPGSAGLEIRSSDSAEFKVLCAEHVWGTDRRPAGAHEGRAGLLSAGDAMEEGSLTRMDRMERSDGGRGIAAVQHDLQVPRSQEKAVA